MKSYGLTGHTDPQLEGVLQAVLDGKTTLSINAAASEYDSDRVHTSPDEEVLETPEP